MEAKYACHSRSLPMELKGNLPQVYGGIKICLVIPTKAPALAPFPYESTAKAK